MVPGEQGTGSAAGSRKAGKGPREEAASGPVTPDMESNRDPLTVSNCAHHPFVTPSKLLSSELYYYYLVVLRFELRVSRLLGRHTAT
jgi:hypothetical protein